MADTPYTVFYINGIAYVVDDSTPLCRYDKILSNVTLYQSPHGNFFTVENNIADDITVRPVSKADAVRFMNEHPAGIFAENYIHVFGQPKQG